jgi:hypothetical protein
VSCRGVVAGIQLLNLRDVARYRLRRDEVDLATKRRLFLPVVEMALCAIPLQAADGARVTSLGVEVGDLLDRQGVVGVEGVATGRGMSGSVASCR